MADAFETAILRLAAQAGPGESVGPADVAREVAQETGVEWEQLLKAVRRAAVKLALDGSAVILLKGEVADPESFRGVYRIGGANFFTPRKMERRDSVRPAPLAPAGDYRPEPRPYTPPSPPAAPAPVRIAVRVAPATAVAAPLPPAVIAPEPAPPVEPPVEPPVVEETPPERSFVDEIESEFERQMLEPAPEPDEAERGIDEGKPVTRFEYAAAASVENEPDFLDESESAEKAEEDPPSPLPPLPPSLSFDDEEDEGYDEDAGRAPRSATLDDIASQLERYLAAELDNPSRGNAEIGDDVVGLPGEQDK